jgi:hypothetical protein
MAAPRGTDARNAKCLVGTNESRTFQQYVADCRTSQDNVRATNFFSESTQKYKEAFDSLRAQFDDLIITGDSMNSLVGLAGATTDGANRQLDTLTKRKDQLLSEINHYRLQGGAADKSFLEDVMHDRAPKNEVAPSLQDVTLLLFWFGWLVMVFTLVAVRYLSPDGNWRSAAFTLVIMLLVTVCMYAILKQVA